MKHRAKEGIRKLSRRLQGDMPLAWVVKMMQGDLKGIHLLILCAGACSFFSVLLVLVMITSMKLETAAGIFGISIAQLEEVSQSEWKKKCIHCMKKEYACQDSEKYWIL